MLREGSSSRPSQPPLLHLIVLSSNSSVRSAVNVVVENANRPRAALLRQNWQRSCKSSPRHGFRRARQVLPTFHTCETAAHLQLIISLFFNNLQLAQKVPWWRV